MRGSCLLASVLRPAARSATDVVSSCAAVRDDLVGRRSAEIADPNEA
jgi:hypothetical protein